MSFRVKRHISGSNVAIADISGANQVTGFSFSIHAVEKPKGTDVFIRNLGLSTQCNDISILTGASASIIRKPVVPVTMFTCARSPLNAMFNVSPNPIWSNFFSQMQIGHFSSFVNHIAGDNLDVESLFAQDNVLTAVDDWDYTQFTTASSFPNTIKFGGAGFIDTNSFSRLDPGFRGQAAGRIIANFSTNDDIGISTEFVVNDQNDLLVWVASVQVGWFAREVTSSFPGGITVRNSANLNFDMEYIVQ